MLSLDLLGSGSRSVMGRQRVTFRVSLGWSPLLIEWGKNSKWGPKWRWKWRIECQNNFVFFLCLVKIWRDWIIRETINTTVIRERVKEKKKKKKYTRSDHEDLDIRNESSTPPPSTQFELIFWHFYFSDTGNSFFSLNWFTSSTRPIWSKLCALISEIWFLIVTAQEAWYLSVSRPSLSP